NALDLEPSLGAVDLRIDSPDELTIVKDGQRVVSVRALVAWRIDLDRVTEPEQAMGPLAMPQERVEGGEQSGALRAESASRGGGERGQILGERVPVRRRCFGRLRDLELQDFSGLEHALEPPAALAGAHAWERQVHAQVHLGCGAQGVKRL